MTETVSDIMNNMSKVGLVGTLVTAVCCFTPALVVVLSLVGLSALTGYLDMVLLPLLVLFVVLWIYGVSIKAS